MLRRLVLFVVIFCAFSGRAERFTGKSVVPAVDSSGYYHLSVSPEVLAVSQNNLADIRIRNTKSGEDIPYLLRTENPIKQQTSFEYYKLLTTDFHPNDSVTHVVIDNENKKTINQFCVIIQNADISKFVSVKGSENRQEWYVVKQKSQVNTTLRNDENSEILIVNIPTGNYRYYDIQISNPQHDPVKALQAGKYLYSEILGKYTSIPFSDYIRKDSTDKKSYFYFTNVEKNYVVNRISFRIDNRKPFRREARILLQETGKDGKVTLRLVRSFTLSSERELVFELGNLRLNKSLFIEIDNKDNNPLNIQGITFYQLNRYLTIYLEKDAGYTLFCGDKELSAPEYDIAYFEHNIPANLPVLELQKFEAVRVADQPKQVAKDQNFMETPAFLWSVISLVGILLLWICVRMMKDMK